MPAKLLLSAPSTYSTPRLFITGCGAVYCEPVVPQKWCDCKFELPAEKGKNRNAVTPPLGVSSQLALLLAGAAGWWKLQRRPLVT